MKNNTLPFCKKQIDTLIEMGEFKWEAIVFNQSTQKDVKFECKLVPSEHNKELLNKYDSSFKITYNQSDWDRDMTYRIYIGQNWGFLMRELLNQGYRKFKLPQDIF